MTLTQILSVLCNMILILLALGIIIMLLAVIALLVKSAWEMLTEDKHGRMGK